MGEHGPAGALLLAASREVSGPTFKFSSTPSSPRPAAAQARPRKEEGLSWPGLDLFSRSCQRSTSCCLHLPSCQRQEFHLSFPSLSLLLSISTPFIKEL